MTNKIYVDAIFPQEIRVAVVDKENKITNFDYESNAKKFLKGQTKQ